VRATAPGGPAQILPTAGDATSVEWVSQGGLREWGVVSLCASGFRTDCRPSCPSAQWRPTGLQGVRPGRSSQMDSKISFLGSALGEEAERASLGGARGFVASVSPEGFA